MIYIYAVLIMHLGFGATLALGRDNTNSEVRAAVIRRYRYSDCLVRATPLSRQVTNLDSTSVHEHFVNMPSHLCRVNHILEAPLLASLTVLMVSDRRRLNRVCWIHAMSDHEGWHVNRLVVADSCTCLAAECHRWLTTTA